MEFFKSLLSNLVLMTRIILVSDGSSVSRCVDRWFGGRKRRRREGEYYERHGKQHGLAKVTLAYCLFSRKSGEVVLAKQLSCSFQDQRLRQQKGYDDDDNDEFILNRIGTNDPTARTGNRNKGEHLPFLSGSDMIRMITNFLGKKVCNDIAEVLISV